MSPVHKFSAMGSLTTNKIDYPSMLAGYGDFGALQRIGYTIGTGSYVIQFSNIPQTFQDLIIVASNVRDTATAVTTSYYMQFNNQTSPNTYSSTSLRGDGSSATSTRNSNQVQFNFGAAVGATAGANIFGCTMIHILNYRSSTFKTFLNRSAADANGAGATTLDVGLWQNTAAITQISLNPVNAFDTNARIALYGVKASAA